MKALWKNRDQEFNFVGVNVSANGSTKFEMIIEKKTSLLKKDNVLFIWKINRESVACEYSFSQR